MKFSIKWVNEFTDISDKSVEEIKEAVWTRLSEIESIENLNEKYRGLLVARVIEKRKHPRSNKLFIAQLDIGSRKVQVVAGAGNFEVGDFVPYTPVGVRVPVNAYPERFDGIVRAIKLAGELSEGMMNSEYELGISDDHSGILILKADELLVDKLTPGMSLAEVLGYNDIVVEIENKALTHRGDVFSVIGVARELAAIFKREFHVPNKILSPDVSHLEKADLPDVDVNIDSPTDCLRYSGIIIEDLSPKPSPLWLRATLAKFGIKSVNNIVDVTNYIMLLYGQPLHAFDFDKAFSKGNPTIVVRRGRTGETLKALDDKEYRLDEDILLIANESRPLAIAGVIGGKESAITSDTQRVFLESATFNQYTIRRSSMKLGIFTDAATVFSRAQDPNKTTQALKYAVNLLNELGGKIKISQITDNYPHKRQPSKIIVSLDKIRDFLGLEITDAEILDIFSRLGINYRQREAEQYELEVPTYRFDLRIKEDIYEEVIRIYGYERLNLVSPLRDVYPVRENEDLAKEQHLKQYLAHRGLFEMINFNFVSSELYKNMGLDLSDAFKIINAVSKEVEYVRPVLVPQLLENIFYNKNFAEDIGVFEVGKTFRKSWIYPLKAEDAIFIPSRRFSKDEDNLPVEDKHLAIALSVRDKKMPLYYYIKRYVDELMREFHLDISYEDLESLERFRFPEWIKSLLPLFKPGRTALLVLQDSVIGIIGEISRRVIANFSYDGELAAAEISFEPIKRIGDMTKKFVQPSRYPAVWEDLCFIVNKDVRYKELYDAIWEVNTIMVSKGHEALIREVLPVDIYQNKERSDYKQITLRVVLQSYSKTLKEKDRQAWRKRIIKNVEIRTGGKLKTI